MVFLSFQRILVAVVLSALTNILGALAVPAGWENLDHDAREILKRATPAAPHFVVYGDAYTPGTTGPPAPSTINVRHPYRAGSPELTILPRTCRASMSLRSRSC